MLDIGTELVFNRTGRLVPMSAEACFRNDWTLEVSRSFSSYGVRKLASAIWGKWGSIN